MKVKYLTCFEDSGTLPDDEDEPIFRKAFINLGLPGIPFETNITFLIGIDEIEKEEYPLRFSIEVLDPTGFISMSVTGDIPYGGEPNQGDFKHNCIIHCRQETTFPRIGKYTVLVNINDKEVSHETFGTYLQENDNG